MRPLLFALLVAGLPFGLFGHLAGAEGPGPDAGSDGTLPFQVRLAVVAAAAVLVLAAYRVRTGLLGPGIAAALALVACPSLPDAVATPLAEGRLWSLPVWGAALLLATMLSAGEQEERKVRLWSPAVAGVTVIAVMVGAPGAETFGAEALSPRVLFACMMALMAGEIACLLARRGDPESPARRALVAGLAVVILGSAALGQVRAHAWRDAVSFWDRAVRESPRSPAALGASAGARAGAGDRQGAADRLRRTAEAVAAGEGRGLGAEARRIGALGVVRAARLLLDGGTPADAETAEASLRAAREFAPGSVPVLVALSDARLARGDFLEPLRLLEDAVALDRASAGAWDALARARLAARALPEALEAAKTATGLDPMEKRFVITWAEALLVTGRGGEALSALRRLLGPKPPYDPALARAYADTELRLAREDVSAGRPGRARRKLLSAGEVDRGNGACADFLRELDREMAEERPKFAETLRLDAAGKMNPDAWLHYIIWLCRWGEFEEAEPQFRRLLALLPSSHLLHFHYGLEFWEGRGTVEGAMKAVDEYRIAIALDERFVDAWNRLWHCLRDLGRIEEAVAAARKFYALDPTHPDALDALELMEGR